MVRPKKYLGQHFLKDENIAAKIVAALDPACPVVLEVGPGMGVLSKYLLDSPRNPWFVEVDAEAAEYLEGRFPQMQGRLIRADFLDFDLASFPPGEDNIELRMQPFAVIGNFPYNISSQILFHVLDHRTRVAEVVGMFQKEVAERLAAKPGSKTYGILSILLQAFYDIEYLFTVNETVFYPPPRVKSAVIRLRRNTTETLGCDETLFTRVVKTAFNQRRKTLRNAIRAIVPQNMPHSAALSGYLDRRAEQLSVDDFVRLAAEISNFAPTNLPG